MQRYSLLVIASVVLSLPQSAWAEATPESIIDEYLKGVIGGKSSAAFDSLMTHSKVDEVKPREILLTKGQIEQSFSLYGAPLGYERISEKSYGSSIVRLIYVTKHQDLVLVWNFLFYRPADSWQLLNFHFNDQLQNLE